MRSVVFKDFHLCGFSPSLILLSAQLSSMSRRAGVDVTWQSAFTSHRFFIPHFSGDRSWTRRLLETKGGDLRMLVVESKPIAVPFIQSQFLLSSISWFSWAKLNLPV
jgi:hypothetical protein